MVSDEELEKALRWVVRGLKEDNVDPNNIQAVVTWMIENPMPDKAVWLEETEKKDEEERLTQIDLLKDEIKRLEDMAPKGVIERV